MLLDILSPQNQITFNTCIAQKLGLYSAIYLSELMRIQSIAVSKNATEDNCFLIDRAYIQKRTTLKEKEQLQAEEILSDVGILEISKDADRPYKLDLNTLYDIFNDIDKATNKDISKIVAKNSQKNNKEFYIALNLKKLLPSLGINDDYIKPLFEQWIDTVFQSGKTFGKPTLENAVKIVTQASTLADGTRDANVAYDILTIAINSCWINLQWAVNSYKKGKEINSYKKQQNTPAYAIPKSTNKVREERKPVIATEVL